MDKKSERLTHRIEKSGIRASLKEGHTLTRPELLDLKIQILPTYLRIALTLSGILSAIGSYLCFISEHLVWGIILAILAFLLLFFGIFGVRRTLSAILDSLDMSLSTEIIGAAFDGISSAVGSLFDGV